MRAFALAGAVDAAVQHRAITHHVVGVPPLPPLLPSPSPPPLPPLAPAREALVSRGQVIKGGLLAVASLVVSPALAPEVQAGAGAVVASEAAAATSASAAALASLARPDSLSAVLLSTLSDCQLAVSVYPTFSYDAGGGGGSGSVRQGSDGLLHLTFDPATLDIPSINWQHAKILGIPLPPPFNIAIVPQVRARVCGVCAECLHPLPLKPPTSCGHPQPPTLPCPPPPPRVLPAYPLQRLEGTLDPATGRVDLDFLAQFEFTAGPLYAAPPLVVATTLTSEASEGVLRRGQGQRLRADGRARLVGVARVPSTLDPLLNAFLQLPTDALAVLSAELSFS